MELAAQVIGRDWPRPLALVRHADPSGVSGRGVVAAGVVWPDGRAVFRWSGVRPPTGHDAVVRQLCLFDALAEITTVHGHQGATDVVTRDPMSACTDLGLAVFGIVGTYGVVPVASVAYWGVAYVDGPAVTWRCDPSRPSRVEVWPGGWESAWAELRDGEMGADEVRVAWVPGQAADLVHAHPTYRLYGRRLVHHGGLEKSPHLR